MGTERLIQALRRGARNRPLRVVATHGEATKPKRKRGRARPSRLVGRWYLVGRLREAQILACDGLNTGSWFFGWLADGLKGAGAAKKNLLHFAAGYDILRTCLSTRGEIGIHARFRFWCRKVCGFKSHRVHQRSLAPSSIG